MKQLFQNELKELFSFQTNSAEKFLTSSLRHPNGCRKIYIKLKFKQL